MTVKDSMAWQHLNWLDYAIILLIAISTMISLIRGFIREALSLASWILAFWVAITFNTYFSSILHPYIESASLRIGVAFFALFALTLILGAMVNFLLTSLIVRSGLNGTDRLLGLVFGFGRGILLVAVLLLAGNLILFSTNPFWRQSQLIPFFQPVEVWLKQFLPENLHKNIQSNANHSLTLMIDNQGKM